MNHQRTGRKLKASEVRDRARALWKARRTVHEIMLALNTNPQTYRGYAYTYDDIRAMIGPDRGGRA